MLTEVLKPVLVIVIGFALKWALGAIGVEMDETTFNAIVAGIVTWLLTALGIEFGHKVAPNRIKSFKE